MSDVITVVLVDDHPVVRDGLRALLATIDDVAVVGEAGSGEEAIEVVASLPNPPHVVIMDVDMPGIGGVEATRRLAATPEGPAVLVLTMYEEHEQVTAALAAGALGYVVKGAQQVEVLHAIRGVASGAAVVGSSVAAAYLGTLASAPRPQPFPQLTARERDILALLATGSTPHSAARRLGLRPKTVANHVSNILSKLPAVDRHDAIAQARRAGLTPADPQLDDL